MKSVDAVVFKFNLSFHLCVFVQALYLCVVLVLCFLNKIKKVKNKSFILLNLWSFKLFFCYKLLEVMSGVSYRKDTEPLYYWSN